MSSVDSTAVSVSTDEREKEGDQLFTKQALRILNERYLQRDEDGRLMEDPEVMLLRVAEKIASAEETEEKQALYARKFEELLRSLEFLPNSPTLMNAGTGNDLQYSACFVLPVEDSMEGIFETIKNAAIIHKSGGGTGFAFSRLRPQGALVQKTSGVASGPVSFMKIFDAATEQVKQGGRRRGANMGILRVDHPDIEEFIHCKLEGGITNFNISVGVTESFMSALEEDGTYDLVAPHTEEVVDSLRAREVWDWIASAAWKTGDPGVVFLDRINESRANPVPKLEEIEATNPCGEQSLPPNDACNLGSVDLAKFYDPERQTVDIVRLIDRIQLAVRFLDNVITVNPFPLEEIEEKVKKGRRIGLGVMGWADLLFKLRIPYDSSQARELASSLMEIINATALEASLDLGLERGDFPAFEDSQYGDHVEALRNSTRTTIAPTGSISILAGCSSGIEPVFALSFQHIVDDRTLSFVNPIFRETVEEMYEDVPGEADKILSHVQRHGSLEDLEFEDRLFANGYTLSDVFVTAHEIAPEDHVLMQAAFQEHTDNGVSKTINLPNKATEDDIQSIYELAYQEGCLGITIFRDGCKSAQVLNRGDGSSYSSSEKAESPASSVDDLETVQNGVRRRPQKVDGTTYEIPTPVGNAFVTVNHDSQGEPFELFLNVGKAGSDIASVSEAIARMISLYLRASEPVSGTQKLKKIIEQFEGIGGRTHIGYGPNRVASLPDAVAQVLAQHIGEYTMTEAGNGNHKGSSARGIDLCPDCGNVSLVREEGCKKCAGCGYSEC